MEYIQWRISGSEDPNKGLDKDTADYCILFRFNAEEIKRVDKFHEKMKLSAEQYGFDYKEGIFDSTPTSSSHIMYMSKNFEEVVQKSLLIMELFIRIYNS